MTEIVFECCRCNRGKFTRNLEDIVGRFGIDKSKIDAPFGWKKIEDGDCIRFQCPDCQDDMDKTQILGSQRRLLEYITPYNRLITEVDAINIRLFAQDTIKACEDLAEARGWDVSKWMSKEEEE